MRGERTLTLQNLQYIRAGIPLVRGCKSDFLNSHVNEVGENSEGRGNVPSDDHVCDNPVQVEFHKQSRLRTGQGRWRSENQDTSSRRIMLPSTRRRVRNIACLCSAKFAPSVGLRFSDKAPTFYSQFHVHLQLVWTIFPAGTTGNMVHRVECHHEVEPLNRISCTNLNAVTA